ncbi:MAG: FtsQ-type POTRA domain-containing protein, partial [Rhizobiales bacterium]|nr:FtsQ-type POTRA domain-containing protein [Hyphomicrobiales bacterium]
MQAGKNRYDREELNVLQSRLKQNVSDRLYPDGQIQQNEQEFIYNNEDGLPEDDRFLRESTERQSAPKADFSDKIEFSKNVFMGIAILIKRPIASLFRKIRQVYTYWGLKFEQTNLFNTSLRGIFSSGFIIIFIISAAILYRNGHISSIKQTIIEKVGEWSGAAGVNVRLVTLTNRQHANEQQIINALNVKIGTPLLSFDVDAAKARIEAIGWVKEAKVQRIFPDALNISIIERVPFAIWQINQKLRLIDRNGVLVANEVLSGYQFLPLIVGEGAEKEALGILSALEERLEIFEHVRALVRVGSRRWDLDMKNGIRVLLPADKPESMLEDL